MYPRKVTVWYAGTQSSDYSKWSQGSKLWLTGHQCDQK